jgi:hypothetical protein
VGLGGEVHDQVGVRHERVGDVAVGDVADDERDGVAEGLERGRVARVGELVEDRHFGVGAFCHGLVDEVGADEAGPSGDEYAHDLPSLGAACAHDRAAPIGGRAETGRGGGTWRASSQGPAAGALVLGD